MASTPTTPPKVPSSDQQPVAEPVKDEAPEPEVVVEEDVPAQTAAAHQQQAANLNRGQGAQPGVAQEPPLI